MGQFTALQKSRISQNFQVIARHRSLLLVDGMIRNKAILFSNSLEDGIVRIEAILFKKWIFRGSTGGRGGNVGVAGELPDRKGPGSTD